MNVTSLPPSLEVETLFPFPLDNFQLQAIAALNANKSVVVCVPTGSGKTLVGEYAIHRALARGKRVFYTTPLKALSNQKLRDFRRAFGADQVGLVTGDITLNREASVLVMTTEVFRNMLYGTPIGQIGTSLEGVEAVVLDECHYMNDPSRGTVWEESIVYCPPKVQLVALSATIANAGQLTDWINQVHGPTELIQSDFRPVPLEFYFSNRHGLYPLLDKTHTKLHPELKGGKRGKRQHRVKREDCPSTQLVVAQLSERDLLPAIYFIFSRRGCDEAVKQMDGVVLVTEAESAEINRRARAFLQQHPEGERAGQFEPLTRGIAAHHAGILPAWKGLVEELFGSGLVKVVFATETLAAGINMPARTTVISSVSKRTDRGHRMLRASEFLQMAGRAGRRGMDKLGHVVCVQTRFEGAKESAFLATRNADPLVSQFTPTYGMVLNLLQTHTIEEARNLLERSFAQYLASLKQIPEQKAIAELSGELARIDVELAPVTVEDLNRYEKQRAQLKEERRILKYLVKEVKDVQAAAIAAALKQASLGQILYLGGKDSVPIEAVLYAIVPGSAGNSDLHVCLGADNRWYAVGTSEMAGVAEATIPTAVVEALAPPDKLAIKSGQVCKGTDATAEVARSIRDRAAPFVEDPTVAAQREKISHLETQLDRSPLHQWGKPGNLVKQHQRRLTLREEVRERQAKAREHQSQHWQEFLNIVSVLQEMDALNQYVPTKLGEAAAAIRGDNELWLGMVLACGCFDDLDPQHLAAACCAIVSEPPRSDFWTNYEPPEPTLEAIAEIKEMRRQLFQTQRRCKVAMPIWMEVDMVGIIEQWVLGKEWNDLFEQTNMDEGDIVRMLRRTMDFLSQIPHVPHLSNSLRENAKRALQLMERFPVDD